MATVYQETGIRNLTTATSTRSACSSRPSQGWGSRKQLLDPYYATDKFYDALVKIDDWETGGHHQGGAEDPEQQLSGCLS